MKFKLFKKVQNTYERNIARKPEMRAKFLMSLAAITVIAFLVFGIRPLAITTSSNNKALSDLGIMKQDLTEKLLAINIGAAQMEQLSEQINILYTKLPNEVLLEEYLKTLVLSAAKEGFVVQRFRQQDESAYGIPLEVEFTGNISRLPGLIEALEKSRRFTVVESLRTNIEDDFTIVRVNLIIFKI